MRKLYCCGMVLAALFMGLMASCNLDRDFEEYVPKEKPLKPVTLSVPEGKADAKKFVFDSNSEGIASVELTDGGLYIIRYKNGYYAPGRKEAMPRNEREVAEYLVRRFSAVETRAAYDNVKVGAFTKDQFGVFRLDNGWTLEIVGTSQVKVNGMSFTVTVPEPVEDGRFGNTRNLCRTWKPVNYRLYLAINGKRYFEKNCPTMRELLTAYCKYMGMDIEDFYDDVTGGAVLLEPELVDFSSNGTYTVTYSNSSYVRISDWEWQKGAEGHLHWWDYGYSSPFNPEKAEGIVPVKFSGNEMIFTEGFDSQVDEDDYNEDEVIPFSIQCNIIETLTEYKPTNN